MKIVSPFKDYYDNVNHIGNYDDSTIYVRKTENIDISNDINIKELLTESIIPPRWFRMLFDYSTRFIDDNTCNVILIGFCGEIHPALTLTQSNGETATLYTIDQIHKFIETHISADRALDFITSKNQKYTGLPRSKRHLAFTKRSIESCFDYFKNNLTIKQLFTLYKVPTFKIEIYNNRIDAYTNPCLTDYNFPVVFDPWTANQELTMFLNGPLCNQLDPSDNRSDVIKRDSHGFNDKSFKKSPTKHFNRK